MVLLGLVERFCRLHQGYNRLIPLTAGFQLLDGFLGSRLLLRAVEEDDRAILGAVVRALPVELGRVMVLEKDVQQRFERHFIGVKLHFDYLGMPRGVRTYLFVGRIVFVSPRIPYEGIFDTFSVAECNFNAPEAAGAEGGSMEIGRHKFEVYRVEKEVLAFVSLYYVVLPGRICIDYFKASCVFTAFSIAFISSEETTPALFINLSLLAVVS